MGRPSPPSALRSCPSLAERASASGQAREPGRAAVPGARAPAAAARGHDRWRGAGFLRFVLLLALSVVVSASPPLARAGGGRYRFDGGTARQQSSVRAALNASAFDWSLVPAEITIHLAPGVGSYAAPGQIWIDSDLLNAGEFAWGVIQHEYAHEVDFFLLSDALRAKLLRLLGGKSWCQGGAADAGLSHSDYGCERFASTLAWAYWPSPANAYKPDSPQDESAAIAPARFRALLARLIDAPDPLAHGQRPPGARPAPSLRRGAA